MANEVRIISTLKDNVTGPLGKMTDKFDTLGKSKGFQSIVSGVGVGIGVAVWNQAVGSITGVIGDMIQAAREDEASIQKLGTALRDNVKDFDGNTAAIEKTLKARINLGFSDDEQRISLGTLATATHDVTKSLALEAGAMDIARARNIDLATASDAVAKAYAGNMKGLKNLIPGLNMGKSSSEALANAFAAVRGQAEDFAKTEEGRVVVAQAKVNESMETFGYKILPFVTDKMVDSANAFEGLAAGIDLLTDSTSKTAAEQEDLAHTMAKGLLGLGPFANWIGSVGLNIMDFGKVSAEVASATEARSAEMLGAFESSRDRIGTAFGDMESYSGSWRETFKDDSGEVIRASNRMRQQLVKDAAIIRGDVFDETEIRADLHDKRMELLALEERRRSAKTAEARRQASDDIVQALDDEGQGLEDLADQGKLTNKDVDRFAADVKKNYKSLSTEGRKQVDALIARYRVLAGQKDISKNFTLNYHYVGKDKKHGGAMEFAKGGVVPGPKGAPQEAIVHSGETVRTPEQEAALARRGGTGPVSGGGMAGGGNSLTVNFYAAPGGSTAGANRQLAQQLLPPLVAEMKRQGFLPRTATGLTG